MALKDWKKTSSLTWRNEKIGKSLTIAEGFRYNTQIFTYTVLVNDLPPKFHRYIEKKFKTRFSALKFARSYMRRN